MIERSDDLVQDLVGAGFGHLGYELEKGRRSKEETLDLLRRVLPVYKPEARAKGDEILAKWGQN